MLASEISTQIELHRPYGGVVPELASRNHILHLQPLVQAALKQAGCTLEDMHAIAATAGPGLVSSLLMGNTAAKSLALCLKEAVFGSEPSGRASALAIHWQCRFGEAGNRAHREWWEYRRQLIRAGWER